MTMFGSQWLANAGGAGYEIDQSIRFNDDDDAKLTRTFGTATNRKIYTLSVWEKNGSSAGSLLEYNATGGVTWANITFGQNGRIDYFDYSGGSARIDLRTSAIYRDPSAWYHVVVAVDTTQATSTDRIKMYVNGVQITSFGTATYPSLNFEGFLNSSVLHLIGDGVNGPFDGYLGEYHFIDGQALAPTDFGEYNDDGVWIPKAYSGAYGTNGFYITGATAADLGEDFSGNNNDFTSTGLATTDQMLDTPTLNYCTMNPLDNDNMLLSDGNLKSKSAANAHNAVSATFSIPESGTSYFEFTCDDDPSGANAVLIGVIEGPNTAQNNYTTDGPNLDFLWLVSTYNGLKSNGSGQVTYGSGFSTGQVGMCAINRSSNKIWWGNATTSTWFASGDPAAGTNEAFSNLPATGNLTPIMGNSSVPQQVTFNFGQSGFLRTPPTGFVALNTANLPSPSITDGSAQFQTSLWNGNSSTQTITQSGNSIFTPGLIWSKSRDALQEHVIFDQVRGTTKYIEPDNTGAEGTQSGVTAFNSDGFDLGSWAVSNGTGQTHVGWQWKANGAGSSNTDGSITSTVSNNSTAGFSIGTYTGIATGPGDAPGTVGHGLGISPGMIIIKDLTAATEWYVWHQGMSNPAQSFIYLNTTGAAQTSTATWNNTAPTSSVFSIGWDTNINTFGNSHVFYAFAEIPGYSSIGSYAGNSSTNGTFVYCGFKPAFIMTKRTDSTSDWTIEDTTRSTFNLVENALFPNLTSAEDTTGDRMDILSNGFKLRTTAQPNVGTLIYMAFSENPFGGDGAAPATAR